MSNQTIIPQLFKNQVLNQDGNKNKKPLVSVVMPIYNPNHTYFKIAIESILNQTYSHWELIILDDCSKDNAFDTVISQYNDSRIRFIRNDKHIGIGAANARNLGMSYARGKYIAVLDQDDVSYPERLEKQVDYMEQHQDVGILGTKYRQIPDEFVYDKTGTDSYLKAYALLINPPFGHSTVMMRKSLLDETGIRYNDTVICEDYRLWLDMMNKTRFANLDEVLLDYRNHPDSISHDREVDLSRDARQSQIRTAFRLMNEPLSEENENLLCRLLTGQTLSKEQLNKALYVHSKIVKYCEKTYGMPATEKALKKSYETLTGTINDSEYASLLQTSTVQSAFHVNSSDKNTDMTARVNTKTMSYADGKAR